MERIVVWVQAFAMGLGAPGLFVIGFLDSSFLSLPQINDLLLIWMVTQRPEHVLLYALMATLGSLAGCFVLYVLARKGGEAFILRRVRQRHLHRGMRLFQRYGVLAVMVPALLPPPAPFKLFVLLAGVAQVPPWQFGVAIGVSRGIRYFGTGLLAVRYGEQAADFLRRHGAAVSWTLVALAIVAGTAYIIWRRRQGRPSLAVDEEL